jgi:polysaccharide biosynthesis/export protein
MKTVRLLVLGVFLAAIPAGLATGQAIPPAVQQELNRKNMTVAEARAMATQLGINLDDPVQAVQRARELGVPESSIQGMLRAIREDKEGKAAATVVAGVQAVDPTVPPEVAVPNPPSAAAAEIIDEAVEAAELRDVEEAQTATVVEEEAKEEGLQFFGYDLFDSLPEAFQPNATGPVDDGYVVGSGDELRLTVWGAAEFSYDLTVDAEGRIFVPKVGQFLASGRRMDVLRQELKLFLSRSYAGLTTTDPPTVFMDVTLARLRPVQIYVLGEVARPGGYTVSPYSTGFNVLYATGGPLTRGSLRSIRIVRNSERVGSLDLYTYLLNGYEADPVRLQTNDFLFVPPRGKTVAISGSVRRPGVFELKGGEDFDDLLRFAGGLLPDAYGKRFQIESIIPIEERTDPSVAREVTDVDLERVLSGDLRVRLRDGDVVTMFSISERVKNGVSIQGAVFQTGRYELSESLMTARDLIMAADGLRENAYLERAELVRLGDDFSSEQLISLDLAGILRDDPGQNIPLKAKDRLRIFSLDDVQSSSSVSISGHVRNPQSMAFRSDLTVYDLLFAGGGLQDSLYVKSVFLRRADLLRKTEDGLSERIIPFDLGDALAGRGMATSPLKPFDEIRIYAQSSVRAVESNATVSISGRVLDPKSVPFRTDMTVNDLLFLGGGLQDSLFVKTVYLDRADILRRSPDGLSGEILPFSLKNAVEGGVAGNLRLQPYDEIRVYAQNSIRERASVSISGRVRNPHTIEFRDGMTIFDLLFEGRGLQDSLFVKNVFLGRADLFRFTDDLQDKRVIPFDLGEALSGQGFAAEVLRPGDEVRVYPRTAVQVRARNVSITGAVANPGPFPWQEGLTLEDLILRANGFTAFSNLREAEVTRTEYGTDDRLATTIRVPLLGNIRDETGALFGPGEVAGEDTLAALFSARGFLLRPLDRVVIRTDPDYRPLETVLISGEVMAPGEYTIEFDNEKLRSFIRRAGGLAPLGYAGGGQVYRGGQRLVIDFKKAIAGSRRHNIELQPGDQILVPREPKTVRVTGNVPRPGLFNYVAGKRMSYYLGRAGGTDVETEAIFVTQADGATFKMRRGLFPGNPRMSQGGRIDVTRKPPPDPNDAPVDISGAITNSISVISAALTVVLLATRL